MNIFVMNRTEAVNWGKPSYEGRAAMISISVPGRTYDSWPHENVVVQDILFVEFFDVLEKDATPYVPSISEDTANKIAAAVSKWMRSGVKNLFVHCDDGKRRAAGVAKAIADYYGIPDQVAYWHGDETNHTVYLKVLSAIRLHETLRNHDLSDTALKNLQTISTHAFNLPILANAGTFTEARANRIRQACDEKNLALIRELVMPMTWSIERDRIDAAAKMRCNLINRAIADCYREVMSEAYQTLAWIILNMPEERRLSDNLDKIMQGMVYENVDVATLRHKILDLKNSTFNTDNPDRIEDIRRSLQMAADRLNILVLEG